MTDPDALPEHVAANRAAWDSYAPEYYEAGRRAWGESEPSWGLWGVPESELRLLPDDLAGRDTIELGCGTAYVSAWLARLDARPVGIDNSPKQLEAARTFQREFGIDFPLHLGYAESTPFADASFDLAISEYGACLWADPFRWVTEAARILRPGGRLVFLTNHVLLDLCMGDDEADDPVKDRLVRPMFGMYRTTWPGEEAVEFHLPHGEWIRVLREAGLEIERLVEIQAPPDAIDHPRYTYVTADWARRWPSEEVWIARKRA